MSNLKVEQLTKQIQIFIETATEKESILKEKSEKIEDLRRQLQDQTKQFTEKLTTVEKQRDKVIYKIKS